MKATMILGIGIDSVEIARFAAWPSFDHASLRRVFSEEEIAYCLLNPAKSAERFAVRFAAREAFYKALTMYHPEHNVPFLTLCYSVTITKKGNVPHLVVDWQHIGLNQHAKPVETLLSLTHTEQIATAFVILQTGNK